MDSKVPRELERKISSNQREVTTNKKPKENLNAGKSNAERQRDYRTRKKAIECPSRVNRESFRGIMGENCTSEPELDGQKSLEREEINGKDGMVKMKAQDELAADHNKTNGEHLVPGDSTDPDDGNKGQKRQAEDEKVKLKKNKTEVEPVADLSLLDGAETAGVANSVKGLEGACSSHDRTTNYYLSGGAVPKLCQDKECILGIDEAGRGPVLGPMVYGIAYVPKEFESDLKDTGCDDSKQLTEEKREAIFDRICALSDKIGWEAEVISPTFISNCMLRRVKTSLNEISHNAAIALVQRAISGGAKIAEIYVDTVGPAEKYQDKLQGIFTNQVVTVRSKADAIYPVVGAASIVAKVTRDVALRGWDMSKVSFRSPASAQDVAWGSGYPNDPVTKTFLTQTMDSIFGFDDVVRFSWSTSEKILEENAVSVEWEDEELTSKGKGNQKIRNFFSNVDLTIKERHRFLKERQLTSVVDF